MTYFDAWIRAFDRLMDAAPKLVTVPYLYSGKMQMGTYMQVAAPNRRPPRPRPTSKPAVPVCRPSRFARRSRRPSRRCRRA